MYTLLIILNIMHKIRYIVSDIAQPSAAAGLSTTSRPTAAHTHSTSGLCGDASRGGGAADCVVCTRQHNLLVHHMGRVFVVLVVQLLLLGSWFSAPPVGGSRGRTVCWEGQTPRARWWTHRRPPRPRCPPLHQLLLSTR